MERVKVLKFGGSPLKDKAGFFNATEIANRLSPCAVIVSAPGRRHQGDAKVTDLFYRLYLNKDDICSYCNIFSTIIDRFSDVCANDEMRKVVLSELDYIFDAVLRSENADYVASRGEYLSAKIFSMYSGYAFWDATDVFEKTDTGIYLCNSVKSAIKSGNVVIPGFYYGRYGGGIVTLGRGGSDLTGAIVARDVKADEYLNFTDVDGVMTASPSIVKDACNIHGADYEFLGAMAFFGSDVMQSEAVEALRGTGVTLIVRDANNPFANGTVVSDRAKAKAVGLAISKSGDLRYARLRNYFGRHKEGECYLTPIYMHGEDLSGAVENALKEVTEYQTILSSFRSGKIKTYVVRDCDLSVSASAVHSEIIKNRP